MAERQREKDVARTRLARLVAETPVVGEQIDAVLRGFNGEPGEAGELRSRCTSCWSRSPTGWRTGAPPRTKSTTGASSTSTRWPGCGSSARRCSTPPTGCSRRCCATARSTRVRIDHPDGLFDPARYFEMLQELAARAWGIERPPTAASRGGRSTSSPRRSCRARRRCRARWAGARHDRLQLPERSERPVRQRRARPAHAAHLREAHRAASRRSTTWCTRASG